MQIQKLGYFRNPYFSTWDKNTYTSVRIYTEGIKTDNSRLEEEIYWFTTTDFCYKGKAVYFSEAPKNEKHKTK
jgi:hypothetical protein